MQQQHDEKVNNSVHEFTIHKKHGGGGGGGNDLNLHNLSVHHTDHSKSLMKGIDETDLNQKKKEILDKKRYDQMNKNYNQQANKGGV